MALPTVASGRLQRLNVTDAADADYIYDAFREQVLLSIHMGKAGFFETAPFVGPLIAAVLLQMESVAETIACGPICTFKSSIDIQNRARSLDMKITTAINSYNGLSPQ
ncbi:hypothetical protein F5Y19DRAFT_469991 [Xylariaceae sp. FL1651]|nr:hypothetical protein F5Y19DRAFT_469991 [Xylariaceae sp. FL1651]